MPDIHPTALVSDRAQLAEDVTVGPYALIDGPALIGPGCSIGPRAWMHGQVTMGANNTIGHGVVIGTDPQSLSFHPSTESGVALGDGNTLREYVTINRATIPGANTILGDRNFLMTGAHLAHDVILGNDNVLANNVLLAGHVELSNRAFLGGGSAFHQFLRIGDLAMVAGNASITKDVPPYCMTTRDDSLAGLNTVGLRRADVTPGQRSELKEAYRLLFLRSGTLPEALAESARRTWSDLPSRLIEAVRNPGRRGVLGR